MKIGNLQLKNNFLLAPMAGFSECVFRKICAQAGAGMVETEMVSAKGMLYGNENTLDLLRHGKECTAVQLFGNEPAVFADVVAMPNLADFSVIDINMGCPVPKVASVGAGCVLMKDINLASKIITAAKLNSNKPISVKCRLGWDKDSINVLDFAKMCEDSGADVICVHGRTRQQLYSGKADWQTLAQVKKSVTIPVIGNGDITTAEEGLRALKLYGVDGVMIGRGALGNPWIFSELTNTPFELSLYDVVLAHYQGVKQIWGERFAVPFMRKHLVYYLKQGGINRKTRAELVLENDYQLLLSRLKELLKNL